MKEKGFKKWNCATTTLLRFVYDLRTEVRSMQVRVSSYVRNWMLWFSLIKKSVIFIIISMEDYLLKRAFLRSSLEVISSKADFKNWNKTHYFVQKKHYCLIIVTRVSTSVHWTYCIHYSIHYSIIVIYIVISNWGCLLKYEIFNKFIIRRLYRIVGTWVVWIPGTIIVELIIMVITIQWHCNTMIAIIVYNRPIWIHLKNIILCNLIWDLKF